MPSFNRVTLIGHVGKIEHRITQSGKDQTKINLAINQWTKKGETEKPPIWVKVSFFDRPATKHIEKGMPLLVEGRLAEPEAWADKESGQPRAALTVMGDQFVFLGSGQPKQEPTTQPQQTSFESNEDVPF